MNTDLFKLVTTVIRVLIITITIYVTFCEPNGRPMRVNQPLIFVRS
jgi:hypothetical protein